VGGGLFVANQDVRYLAILEQGVVNMQYSAAGITENEFDAFVLQRADNHLAT